MRDSSNGPRLKDVAELAKVSIKTASRVLNNNENVAPATREAVLAAMRELKYTPDPAARSLRAGHDNSVGVIVDSIGDIFFSGLVAAVEDVLGKAGFQTLIASTNREVSREIEIAEGFALRRCAGLIVAPTSTDSLKDARLRETPVVFVDRFGELAGSQSILTDDFNLAKDATAHLIDHGHSRIAIIADIPVIETTRDRLAGYRAALTAAGISPDDSLIKSNCVHARDVLPALEQLLALPEPPTAILSTSSRLSLGVVPALHQFGRTDIAFISYGDFEMASSLSPAVTVVDHSSDRIGRQAAELLLDRMLPEHQLETEKDIIYTPAHLIQRGSGELLPPASPK